MIINEKNDSLIKYFKRREDCFPEFLRPSSPTPPYARRLTLVVLGRIALVYPMPITRNPPKTRGEENDSVDTRGGSITLSANGFN